MADNPKLAVLSTRFKGLSFELTGDRYTIGRREECDICIPDATISGVHCTESSNEDGVYEVTDENSTNGTQVSGKLVDKQTLSNNDIIQVGNVEILFKAGGTSGVSEESTPPERRHSTISLKEQTVTQPLPRLKNISPFSKGESILQRDWRIKLAVMGAIGAILLAGVVAIGWQIYQWFSAG